MGVSVAHGSGALAKHVGRGDKVGVRRDRAGGG